MKKKTAVTLISCLVLLAAAVFLASNLFHMGKFRLSALSNRQCAKFLVTQGVTIPEKFSDFDFQGFIAEIEENPNIDFVLGWTELQIFSEEIRDTVNAYYGITP